MLMEGAGLRILVMLLLDTLPMLGNVLMLCFFVFFIFGIIGVQLWSGKLRQRCFLDLPDDQISSGNPNLTDFFKYSDPYDDFVCSFPDDSGMRKCYEDKPRYEVNGEECRGNTSYFNDSVCIDWNQYYTICKISDENPFLGSISFDNILYAWIAIFQCDSMVETSTVESSLTNLFPEQQVLPLPPTPPSDILPPTTPQTPFFLPTCGDKFRRMGGNPVPSARYPFTMDMDVLFSFNNHWCLFSYKFMPRCHSNPVFGDKAEESRLIAEQRRRFKSSSTLTSNSELGSCYDEILKYISHLMRKGKRRFRRWRKRMQSKRQGKVMPALTLRRRRRKKKKPRRTIPSLHVGNGSPRGGRAHGQGCGDDPSERHSGVLKHKSSNIVPNSESFHSISYCTEHLSKLNYPLYPECVHSKSSPHSHANCTLSIHRASSINYPPTTNSKDSTQNALLAKYNIEEGVKAGKLGRRWKELCTENHQNPPQLPAVTGDKGHKDTLVPLHQPLAQRLSAPPLTNPYPVLPPAGHSTHTSCPVHTPCPIHTPCPTHAPCLVHRPSCLRNRDEEDASDESSSSGEEEEDEDTSGADSDVEHRAGFRIRRRPIGIIHWSRMKTREIVESKYFMRGILASILINTLSMGIEFHGQPQELTDAIEVSNLIFSSIFALEMIMKVAAYGIFGYIKNGFNVFDGIIVIVSIIEVMQQGSGGLSVLRTFRLLRILKLVRFMPALRRQLLVMLRTMDNVATFFSLLALFIFIFSVLGMHLFGCQFCDEIEGERVCDRKNFDSLLWAIVTVFQILTQEDWNIVLYNGMSRTSPWAAVYFIALMTFGNYVLFNLLVAILVEGFSAEIDRQKEANLQQNGSHDVDMETGKGNRGEPSDEEKQVEEEEEAEDVLSIKSTQAGCHMLSQQPGQLRSPPVITHTAATPQGSPNISSSRLGRPPYKDANIYLDSDSHSVSSLSVSNTPPLSRSGSTRSARNPTSNFNHLTPYVVANGNDRHSTSSESRVSIPSSVSNGHIPDVESNGTESRRTSYISCNGGSMLSQQPSKVDLTDTPVTQEPVEGSSSTHTGDETFEDPDAIDEAGVL
ncbi:putative voltage-dependent T-type calcium channel subunit alpha-1H-like [Apostichopus japonicus]|uniref:Putative voltage-dependent T-type calcium channel subunit alpha-1H-like n=1 Tax=Stichopus japonicus TaxID=307972 RepID=A0A2G8JV62_STIJA|nr:putative voltage-dependent T-type calcium channel subunit alpha-1H-like [Apostichopus japonicus]